MEALSLSFHLYNGDSDRNSEGCEEDKQGYKFKDSAGNVQEQAGSLRGRQL